MKQDWSHLEEARKAFQIRGAFEGKNAPPGSHAGGFAMRLPDAMSVTPTVIVMVADDGSESGWEHVSVHTQTLSVIVPPAVAFRDQRMIRRVPTWEEMCLVKNLFWEPEETVLQFHPRRSAYVNATPYVLHLWKKAGVDHELPDNDLI